MTNSTNTDVITEHYGCHSTAPVQINKEKLLQTPYAFKE